MAAAQPAVPRMASAVAAWQTKPLALLSARPAGEKFTTVSASPPVARTSGGVPYSFECVGLKQTAEQCFGMLRAGGVATLIGMIPWGTKIELHGPDFLRERRIQGSLMGSNRFRTDMPRLIDFYLQGRLHLDEMISGHLKLDKINEGFAALKKGGLARNVIQFDA